MNIVDEMVRTLNIGDTWTDTSGVKWFATGNTDLRQLAEYLGQAKARFVTITANELPRGEGFCLDYLWDLNGQLLGFPFYPSGKAIPSIFDVCEAADWIEREIHEEYAIDFGGREYEPLLLRAGDRVGVNLHEVAK
jgi:hypothetical protein